MPPKARPAAHADGIPVWCAHDRIVPVAALKPHPDNPNTHPEEQVALLAHLILTTGWRAPVTVSRRSGWVVAGHCRRLATLHAGLQDAPVDYQDFASEAEELQHLVADNRVAELAAWDGPTLLGVLARLDKGGHAGDTGFTAEDVADLEAETDPAGKALVVPTYATAEGLLEKWGVAVGDVWDLGPHRILCGDSLAPGAVERVMGGGHTAAMAFTDPPWNVGYGARNSTAGYRRRAGGRIESAKRPILGDSIGADFPAFLSAFAAAMARCVSPGAAVYVVMGIQEYPALDTALRPAGFHWSSTIIWSKDSLVLSRKDYHPRYEPIWYGWREGAPRRHPLRDRTQSDVWDIPRPKTSDEHPMMKPIELVERAVANSSGRGDLVLDFFLGSGTTLLACERLDRRCVAAELDPKFVAVALERWSVMTGGVPKKA